MKISSVYLEVVLNMVSIVFTAPMKTCFIDIGIIPVWKRKLLSTWQLWILLERIQELFWNWLILKASCFHQQFKLTRSLNSKWLPQFSYSLQKNCYHLLTDCNIGRCIKSALTLFEIPVFRFTDFTFLTVLFFL